MEQIIMQQPKLTTAEVRERCYTFFAEIIKECENEESQKKLLEATNV